MSQQPSPFWSPSADHLEASGLARYQRWLAQHRGVELHDYGALWRWSVEHLEDFWDSIWDHFELQADGERTPVLTTHAMPGARWYPRARLNYAEHVFRHATAERPALLARSEDGPLLEVSWAELERDTAALAAALRAWGLKAGDRVASVMPNRAETVVALLACASLGAVWTSCSPDMGPSVLLDRLRQIGPRLLFATDSYRYNGKAHDRVPEVRQLLAELPTLERVVHVPGPLDAGRDVDWRDRVRWRDAVRNAAPPQYERLPFDHPLWVLYSSGTTGLPKALVHGHGGIVLTHLKSLVLHHDVRPGDRCLFLGSTGWMVWNIQVGCLLNGATAVLYDGNPAWPDGDALWRFVDEQRLNFFGLGAAVLLNAMKAGLQPHRYARFERLRSINAMGSPLPVDAYRWVHEAVKPGVWLSSPSGGTDVASGIVSCAATLPVFAGEIPCAELGVAACAYDDAGRPVVGEVGELVITQPMPSMPLYLWNDADGRRYRESYFETFPGVWRHGDWIRFSERGGAVIYGRSDSTINRAGIRMGTAEIYRVVEELPEVMDSLVVDLEYLGRPSFMPLFVVLRPGLALDAPMKARILQQIRTKASARHVPDDVVQVDAVPRTLTGKKMEVPVRKLMLGAEAAKVASRDAMLNPDSLDLYVAYARARGGGAAPANAG